MLMSISTLKRLIWALGITCLLLFAGGGLLFWNYGWLKIHAAFAEEQTRIFEDMRIKALQSTAPADIAGSLQYVVWYYPSGTKQDLGSRLDRTVERHRAATIREIIAHFRRITGQDLGDSPEPWLQKYEVK